MSDESSLSRRELLGGVVASAAVIAAIPESLGAESPKESSPWAEAKWFNEPRRWQMRGGSLVCSARRQAERERGGDARAFGLVHRADSRRSWAAVDVLRCARRRQGKDLR
jgi:hypothetical protein